MFNSSSEWEDLTCCHGNTEGVTKPEFLGSPSVFQQPQRFGQS